MGSSEEKSLLVKNIYLYTVRLIALILIVIGMVIILNIFLKKFIFKEAEKIIIYPAPKPLDLTISEEEWKKQQETQLQYEKEQKVINQQKSMANAISFIVVGLIILILQRKKII
ncbi:MAG: hypothetical protein NZ822_02220 [Patescibacteria group bacterium]|nr:hypothetical protein [Patescibacteria group bacterium]